MVVDDRIAVGQPGAGCPHLDFRREVAITIEDPPPSRRSWNVCRRRGSAAAKRSRRARRCAERSGACSDGAAFFAPRRSQWRAGVEAELQAGAKPQKAKKTKKPKKKKWTSRRPTKRSTRLTNRWIRRRAASFTWKQHPASASVPCSGSTSRKFQEDLRGSYDGAQTRPWDLHRNRVGSRGTCSSRSNTRSSRDHREELDAGKTPKSH